MKTSFREKVSCQDITVSNWEKPSVGGGGGGGMDIFWNHTIQRKKRTDFLVIHVVALKVMNLWVTVPFLGEC